MILASIWSLPEHTQQGFLSCFSSSSPLSIQIFHYFWNFNDLLRVFVVLQMSLLCLNKVHHDIITVQVLFFLLTFFKYIKNGLISLQLKLSFSLIAVHKFHVLEYSFIVHWVIIDLSRETLFSKLEETIGSVFKLFVLIFELGLQGIKLRWSRSFLLRCRSLSLVRSGERLRRGYVERWSSDGHNTRDRHRIFLHFKKLSDFCHLFFFFGLFKLTLSPLCIKISCGAVIHMDILVTTVNPVEELLKTSVNLERPSRFKFSLSNTRSSLIHLIKG